MIDNNAKMDGPYYRKNIFQIKKKIKNNEEI